MGVGFKKHSMMSLINIGIKKKSNSMTTMRGNALKRRP